MKVTVYETFEEYCTDGNMKKVVCGVARVIASKTGGWCIVKHNEEEHVLPKDVYLMIAEVGDESKRID